jgi:hypothetical protein
MVTIIEIYSVKPVGRASVQFCDEFTADAARFLGGKARTWSDFNPPFTIVKHYLVTVFNSKIVL